MNTTLTLAKISFRRHGQMAFTLTEMMVAVSIFIMVIGGVIYAHIGGLKLFECTRVKLGANSDARQTMSLLTSEVRAAQDLKVGNGTANSFAAAADGDDQEGNAVKVFGSNYHPVSNSNAFTYYFLDSGSRELRRMVGGSSLHTVIAEAITNNTVFMLSDHQGNVLTNTVNNEVLGVSLEFYQIQYPITLVGSNQYYQYYQLSAKIARRSI